KDDAERRKQLIAQRRRLHDQVCQRVEALSRTEICRRLLADDGGGLRKRLDGTHQIEVYGFARDIWEFTNKENARETINEGAFTDLGIPSVARWSNLTRTRSF